MKNKSKKYLRITDYSTLSEDKNKFGNLTQKFNLGHLGKDQRNALSSAHSPVRSSY
eukprot:CAMPEP_0170557742 /NCGR_PEP_ID=MMETSP0211-20121228/29713_1 /TAXON_ID=311385 /ORGANISM="Pseudokeronopsis sp., Strain OXSARD2" /LENGTH=55 /DNA_ID=CAMNT_0010869033 /DNA_START=558 /DNA_END=725 /DNA_ORIENTATION=+